MRPPRSLNRFAVTTFHSTSCPISHLSMLTVSCSVACPKHTTRTREQFMLMPITVPWRARRVILHSSSHIEHSLGRTLRSASSMPAATLTILMVSVSCVSLPSAFRHLPSWIRWMFPVSCHVASLYARTILHQSPASSSVTVPLPSNSQAMATACTVPRLTSA